MWVLPREVSESPGAAGGAGGSGSPYSLQLPDRRGQPGGFRLSSQETGHRTGENGPKLYQGRFSFDIVRICSLKGWSGIGRGHPGQWWKCSKDQWMGHFGTWFSDNHGGGAG